MNRENWFAETIIPSIRVEYEASQVLERKSSEYQEMVALDNPLYGRMLMLDGAVQVTSADEFVYHEMLAHVPLLTHGNAKDVLIVGGGDCGLAEEVLKHRGVERLKQVEIDPAVIEFARQHFSQVNAAAFADERFQLEIGDGARFVADTSERFDVVLVDSTDPVGPGRVLFSAEFYQAVRRCLKPGGVLVAQCGVPFVQRKEFTTTMSTLAGVFPIVTCYVIAVPSYTGGHMALGWASESLSPELAEAELVRRFESLGVATRYYTPQVHRAAFALPRYIAEHVPQAR